jgi:hypothetical protein
LRKKYRMAIVRITIGGTTSQRTVERGSTLSPPSLLRTHTGRRKAED